MNDATLKAALDADTDQSLAWAREARAGLSGQTGKVFRDMAAKFATQIKGEFPGVSTGRIVAAVATSMQAAGSVLEDAGIAPDIATLAGIACLAAEQLDRDEHGQES